MAGAEPRLLDRALAQHHPQGRAAEDADEFKDEPDKFDKYFSAEPGEGT